MTTGAALPLDGVRVVEFTQVAAGPMTGLLLAEQGADVIKVEPPTGDVWRHVSRRHRDMSTRFYAVNRGKRSLVIDLKHERGVEIAGRLAAGSDVVLENWRPGVARRLGLDWSALRAANPRLVTMSITGYGPSGPRASDRVYDVVVQGMSGMANGQGPDGRPAPTASVLVDKITAMAAAHALLAALLARHRTGQGRHIDVSMLDVAVAFSWPDLLGSYTFVDHEPRTADEAAPPRTSAVARAGDGRYLTFNSITEENWRGICDFVQSPELFEQYRDLSVRAHRTTQVVAALEVPFRRHTRDAVVAGLRERGVPCGPVHSYADVLTDPQVVHNETVREIVRDGLGRVREPAPMVRLGVERTLRPAPRLGEHTTEVLTELDLDSARIADLLAAGVVRQAPTGPHAKEGDHAAPDL